MLCSFLYLLPAFAELGLNELEVQGFVDIFLGRRSYKPFAAIQAVRLKFVALVSGKRLQLFKVR